MRATSAVNGNRRSGFSPLGLIWFYFLLVLMGGSGMALVYLRFFATSEDPFALVPPSLGFWQKIHVLVAPALTWTLGAIWMRHAAPLARNPYRRLSGWASIIFGLLLVLSGAAFQVATSEGGRQLWRLVHTGVGTLWLGFSLVHSVARRRLNGAKAQTGKTPFSHLQQEVCSGIGREGSVGVKHGLPRQPYPPLGY